MYTAEVSQSRIGSSTGCRRCRRRRGRRSPRECDQYAVTAPNTRRSRGRSTEASGSGEYAWHQYRTPWPYLYRRVYSGSPMYLGSTPSGPTAEHPWAAVGAYQRCSNPSSCWMRPSASSSATPIREDSPVACAISPAATALHPRPRQCHHCQWQLRPLPAPHVHPREPTPPASASADSARSRSAGPSRRTARSLRPPPPPVATQALPTRPRSPRPPRPAGSAPRSISMRTLLARAI